ncbi:MAG: tetratricopeptide repeat protein, partial [Nitrospirae bacterium]|nr:tetratricopeptide repeat protein [Nitrospirota bacterium]
FITLSVESSIIPIEDIIFEHRLYLPSIGLIVAFACFVFYVFSRITHHASHITVLLLAFFVIVLSIAAYQRNSVWQDELSLWNDVVKKSPNKARGYNNLGALGYYKKGAINDAIQALLTSIRLKPDYLEAHINLTGLYYKQGMYDEAIKEIRITQLLSQNENAESYTNLGALYLKKNLPDKAIEYLNHALTLNQYYAPAYNNLSIAYELKGQKDKAYEYFKKAYSLGLDKYPKTFN